MNNTADPNRRQAKTLTNKYTVTVCQMRGLISNSVFHIPAEPIIYKDKQPEGVPVVDPGQMK